MSSLRPALVSNETLPTSKILAMTIPKRSILYVPAAHVKYAKSQGAKWDAKKRVFYFDGDVPPSLADYLEHTPRNRDYTLEVFPSCPLCHCRMELRSSPKRPDFWGCSMYSSPRNCKGYRPVGDEKTSIPPDSTEVENEATCAAERSPPNGIKDAQTRVIVALARHISNGDDLLRWLSNNKVGLGHRVPLALMAKVEGCDEVEAFIERTFTVR